MTTLQFVPGRIATGTDVESRLEFFLSIVWADFAAIGAFIVFFSMAIIRRKNARLHIPLMLFASLSILEPALFRIWGWPIFGGIDRHFLSLIALFMLSLIVVIYEYANVRRVQAITLFAVFFLLGLRVIAIYLISDSDLGMSLITSLSE